jgi:hypothetical protein
MASIVVFNSPHESIARSSVAITIGMVTAPWPLCRLKIDVA